MSDSKTLRGLLALAFSAAVVVGFAGCEATEEAGDELEDMGQIQQHEQIQQLEPIQQHEQIDTATA